MFSKVFRYEKFTFHIAQLLKLSKYSLLFNLLNYPYYHKCIIEYNGCTQWAKK